MKTPGQARRGRGEGVKLGGCDTPKSIASHAENQYLVHPCTSQQPAIPGGPVASHSAALLAAMPTYGTARYARALALVRRTHPGVPVVDSATEYTGRIDWLGRYRSVLANVAWGYVLPDVDGYVGSGVELELSVLSGAQIRFFSPTGEVVEGRLERRFGPRGHPYQTALVVGAAGLSYERRDPFVEAQDKDGA